MRTTLLAGTALAAAGTLLLASPAAAGPSTDLHINEILHNPEGTDSPNEYVEIAGAPGAVIPAGTYLVFVEGDTGSGATAAGDVQNIFDLSGLTLGSNGFLVLLQGNSSWDAQVAPAATKIEGTGTGWTGVAGWQADSSATDIENEAFNAFLVQSATAPSLTMDIDTNGDGVAESIPASWTILDAIGTDSDTTAGNGEKLYTTAKILDGEWVGRGTGDPSGMAQEDWIGSAFANGTPAVNPTLNESVQPAAYTGEALDHLGGPNFPAEPGTEVPEAPLTLLLPLSGIAVAGAIALRTRNRRTA